MSTKSTTEKTVWPTIEEQEAYWRTKEVDLSLDKVEATTDYYDHFLDGNPTSERPFRSNETDLSAVTTPANARPAVRSELQPNTTGQQATTQAQEGDTAAGKVGECPTGDESCRELDSCGGAQNLSIKERERLGKCSAADYEELRNSGPHDGYWRPQDDPHIPDERRLSLENRKAPSNATLAEQKWAEPEWTLRDEVGESYREIP